MNKTECKSMGRSGCVNLCVNCAFAAFGIIFFEGMFYKILFYIFCIKCIIMFRSWDKLDIAMLMVIV